jgi:hypothetical protein
MPGGNDGSDTTGSVPTDAAGSSNEMSGGSVPGGSIPNTAGAGDGTPDPALAFNGGGGAAGSTSMVMGSSGAGPIAGAAGSNGAAGSGSDDTGETEVIGGCFNQLLSNGGFELGHAGWTEVSEAVHDVIVRRDASLLIEAGVTPQAGDYLAWIGGIPSGDFIMYHSSVVQDVAIPAEAQSLTLSGYYWVTQTQPGNMPYDWAVLETEDPDPNVTGVWQVELFNELLFPNTNGWVHFEVTTLVPSQVSAGKTVTVRSRSTPNGSGTLSVFLDSLRLEARCPR